jgi:N-acetyl-gamma-glutamyl-phosphate reductase
VSLCVIIHIYYPMTQNPIRIAIEGAAGYTAGELFRILINHPKAQICYATSTSNNGAKVSDVHRDLLGDIDLTFGPMDTSKVDVIFVCKGHGKTAEFLNSTSIPEGVKIIDLSTDYRDESKGFVYGLPELQRDAIAAATRIANPGCFATGIELALLPLAKANAITNEVHINSITGSTGAGQAPTDTTHFSWRNSNVSVYKPFRHQHLTEIGMSLGKLQKGFTQSINLVPVRGNFSRGILSSIYTKCSLSNDELQKLYTDYYATHPFVRIATQNPDLKQVVNTNKCLLHIDRVDDKVFIVSAIDNLLKGASGQAVQNMNIMFGIDEMAGLRLKGIGF